jgi:hypothetical protein
MILSLATLFPALPLPPHGPRGQQPDFSSRQE